MGGRLNLDGGTLTLDGGTRPPYNLSTGYRELEQIFNFLFEVGSMLSKQVQLKCIINGGLGSEPNHRRPFGAKPDKNQS